MHYNIILANALAENGNRGCQALCYSALFIIDKILTESGIDYTCYIPDSGIYFVNLTSAEGEKQQIKYGNKSLTFTPIKYYRGLDFFENIKIFIETLIGRPSSKKIFQNSDFILDIGSGDSYTDIYGLDRFIYEERIHDIAQKLKKPYCFLPQTIGPFSNRDIEARAKKTINNADCVLARDKQSYDYVKSILPQKRISEIVDVAFFMPYTKKHFDENFIHVGLNISALIWHGGYNGLNQFGITIDYRKVIHSIIDYFLSLPNVKLHLVPHVVSADRNVENDYGVAYDLTEEFNNERLQLAPLFMDPIIAKSYISGLDFFMGARMHSTIAAFSTGVPVVPMAYSRKFNGLFEDTLNYHHMIDMKDITDEEVVPYIVKEFGNRLELKKEIKIQNDTTVKQRVELLEQELKKFFRLV